MFWKRRESREEDLERELRSDLDLDAQELQQQGISHRAVRFSRSPKS